MPGRRYAGGRVARSRTVSLLRRERGLCGVSLILNRTIFFFQVTHKECFDVGANTVTVSFKVSLISKLFYLCPLQIQIVKSSGANPRRVIEFGSEIDHLNDVKLIVEGQAIAVSKVSCFNSNITGSIWIQ